MHGTRFDRIAASTAATLAASLAAAAPPAAAPPTLNDPSGPGPIVEALDAHLSRLPAFGVHAGVLVAKGDEVILVRGYGLADRERDLPFTGDTVFTVGSITKQFTAAAIMKLQERDLLDVQDPIAKYFDEVPPDKSAITLHHLLTHTAGFPGALGDDFDTDATREWIIRAAMEAPLAFEPGTQHEYSNVGYSLLGAIVEIVSGRPYEQFLRDELFLPAGMMQTGYRLPAWDGLTITQGYRGDERWGTVLERPWLDDGPCWNLRANGGIHSTLDDLYKWWRALQDDSVLSAASRKQIFTPWADEGGGRSHYGYGWAIMETGRGTKLIAHNGGNGIMFADFRWYADEDVLILIATGCAPDGGQRLSSIVPSIVFGHEIALPPEIVEVSPAALALCAGTYVLPSGGALHVTVEETRLSVAGNGQEAVALLMTGDVGDSESLAALNERAVHIFSRAREGEYEPIFEALGGELPIERIASMETEMRQDREERFGPFVGIEAVGSAMTSPDRAVTFLRIEHERGSVVLELSWRGETLVGVDMRDRPAVTRLYPQSERRYISYSLDRPERVAIEFERGPDGQAAAAIIETPSGPLRAPRHPAGS